MLFIYYPYFVVPSFLPRASIEVKQILRQREISPPGSDIPTIMRACNQMPNVLPKLDDQRNRTLFYTIGPFTIK